ncbi:MAG: hypothetical protein CMP10_17990 [Zetaproteobacteria bacterium]|nr:hypothetical protein [Pseudobdellovibrionaceae bacterium]
MINQQTKRKLQGSIKNITGLVILNGFIFSAIAMGTEGTKSALNPCPPKPVSIFKEGDGTLPFFVIPEDQKNSPILVTEMKNEDIHMDGIIHLVKTGKLTELNVNRIFLQYYLEGETPEDQNLKEIQNYLTMRKLNLTDTRACQVYQLVDAAAQEDIQILGIAQVQADQLSPSTSEIQSSGKIPLSWQKVLDNHSHEDGISLIYGEKKSRRNGNVGNMGATNLILDTHINQYKLLHDQ